MNTVNNIFAGIDTDQVYEVFDTIIHNDNIQIERIISSGHTSPDTGWYDQANHEWVIVLKGYATIEFEDGEQVALKKGDYLNIPAHHKHRVTQTSDKPNTVWLAIHY